VTKIQGEDGSGVDQVDLKNRAVASVPIEIPTGAQRP